MIYFNSSKQTIHNRNTVRPQLSPGEYMAHQRMFPYNEIKQDVYFEAFKQAVKKQNSAETFEYSWEFAGPTNIGGRITDIEIHPNSPETIYLGAATGGIWKSSNDGVSWEYSFDGVYYISIGDIAIDPNDENIIYAGTGEANASSYSFRGNGIYRSTDAGTTWEHKGLELSAYVGRIIVDYNNSNRLFVAACGNLFTPDPERGVYRSNDGGDSWENILFVNDSTSAIDIVQHPLNPDVLYAAMWERMRGLTYRHSFGDGSGIWKTTNGGDSWEELTNGLITDENAGRIGLSISLSNPDVLYSFYDLPDYEVAVFKTTNGGNTWTGQNTSSIEGMNSNFGWYFGQVRVHPDDENMIWVLGVEIFKSTNGGNSWQEGASWGVHVDHHALYFDEVNNRILLGNDGGLYQSFNNGNSWSKINNLPFTQFYAIDVDYQNPNRLIGGTQDNNTVITYTGNTGDWEAILGGDGMYCLIDYSNPNTLYAEYQWGNLFKSTDGGNNMDYIGWNWEGERVNWSAPLAMDPENPNILYFGTYRVWKSVNGGNSWTNISEDLTQGIDQYFYTLTTLAVSTVNTDIVVAGSGDGMVHVSTNAGGTWIDVTNGLPNRWITNVACDPVDENTIYATISGFRWDEPLAHVYKSTDLGQSWESISSDLPEIPVNAIVIDPEHAEYIYIGTDAGVYFTNNGGDNWHSLNEGIYNVPVVAMKIHNPTRTLVIGTYGVSMYRLSLDVLITNMSEKRESKALFTVYPNPFNKTINLDGPVELVDDFRLFDAHGKHIMWADKQRLNNLPELKTGIYYLHLIDKSGKTISIEKLIKQ
ncbi:MAG: T9SS type A sorting domain-containing protein [Bacteroidales bacterium]